MENEDELPRINKGGGVIPGRENNMSKSPYVRNRMPPVEIQATEVTGMSGAGWREDDGEPCVPCLKITWMQLGILILSEVRKRNTNTI